MWNDEWLARHEEEVIDPLRQITDSHHHLWKKEDRPQYLPTEFQSDLDSGHNVTRSVYLECGWGYREDGPQHLRVVGETETAAVAAREHAAHGGTDVAAIVSYADLTSSTLTEVLDAHIEAGEGRFRGIRQSAAYDPDESIERPRHLHAPDLMDREEFYDGLARLAAKGLTYDSFIYHPQIPQLAKLASAVPQASIVLNHLGAPLAVGSYAGRREEVFDTWAESMVELANNPNVSVKLGGIGLPRIRFEFEDSDSPASSEALAEAWKPYVDLVVSVFGADRIMAESNFPVDKVTMSYRTVWNVLKRLVSDLPESEQDLILSRTARRFYQI